MCKYFDVYGLCKYWDINMCESNSKFGIKQMFERFLEPTKHLFLSDHYFFDAHEKYVCILISVGPAGWVIVWRDKNFNVAIFSDTISVVNVKLRMMVLLIDDLYLLILLSVTITIFQGHGSVRQF